jgi:LPS export ABC transporter protein LptC
MRRKQRIYMLAIMVGFLGLLVMGCGDDKVSSDGGEDFTEGAQPDQVTHNAHIFLYKGGYKTTDLTADEIRQFTTLDSAVATNLTVEFFDTTGTRVSTLTAKEGYIREKDQYLAVSGSVVVIGEDSTRLETEYLEWDGGKDSVVTDSFVTVIEKGDTLMSYGFQSDPELKDVTFKHRVRGRLSDVEKKTDGKK